MAADKSARPLYVISERGGGRFRKIGVDTARGIVPPGPAPVILPDAPQPSFLRWLGLARAMREVRTMTRTSKDHTSDEDAALVAMAATCRGSKGDVWRSTVRDMCLTPAEGLVGAAIQVEILAHIVGWDDCEAWDDETSELKSTVIWSIWRVLSRVTGLKTEQCLGGMLPCYDSLITPSLEPLLHPNTRPALAGLSAGA